MNRYYILVGQSIVPEPDLLTWARWFETAKRHVALTELPGGVKVSTVFLGLDHSFGADEEPLLFETMVFGGPHDQDQYRYPTWAAAEAGHAAVVKRLRNANGDQS
ncbi:MAG: hypothetical protein WA324_12815 [Bryobacteraceae bacterium]